MTSILYENRAYGVKPCKKCGKDNNIVIEKINDEYIVRCTTCCTICEHSSAYTPVRAVVLWNELN